MQIIFFNQIILHIIKTRRMILVAIETRGVFTVLFRKIGHKVKALREEKGLTLDQLAKLAKIDTSTLWRYESGDIRNPSLNVLANLCDALNVSITSFFDDFALPAAQGSKTAKTANFDPDIVAQRIAMLSPYSRRMLIDFLEFIETKETSSYPRRKLRKSDEQLLSEGDDNIEYSGRIRGNRQPKD